LDPCLACGAANRPGRRFCASCGAGLAATCPGCGAENEPEDRFCGGCGNPLTPVGGGSTPGPANGAQIVAPAPVAERRVCSVLFVDLVGFTPLSEVRDAEEVRELLSRYFEVARTVVGRYGGTIEKFIGDAVMAVWGTPVAVEGDAERAVRAGLDLVAAVGLLGAEVGAPDLRARAGIVTGEIAVTVGLAGEGVAGDSVNTAARVQTAAAPGEVWVDEATNRLAGAAIGFTDAGEHSLKGKTEPMRLWVATRVLSGVGGAQRVDGLEAPLLGREAELRTIKELFHAAAERRSPRMVVVSGPAGVGKSRLGWEFEKYIDGLAESVWWHRGRCLSYGDGVAFWALAEIVRQRLAIAEDDPVPVAAAKLEAGLTAYFPDVGEHGYVAARLGRLLGVPIANDGASVLGREELFAGWRLFFERLAASAPVILLVEDAQHADPGLLDFLDHLTDWARDVPLYLLVFARPELSEARPGWGTGRNRTALTLDPLDAVSMDTLVDALVPGMPDAARAAITAQAQGIPLFAVETIRSLIDRDIVVPREGVYRLEGDVGSLAVPDGLRGLLAARLDALSSNLRGLVADAAVLGTSFPLEALAAVSGRAEDDVRTALTELLRREVFDISADRLSPQRGFYRFTQNLLRQVAYETLSRRDRKARHLAVAAHLRSTFAADGEEAIDVIARHYLDALAAVPGDPDEDEVRDLATSTLIRAGERASRSGAPVTASAHYASAAAQAARSSRADAAVAAAGLWERAAAEAVIAADVEAAVAHADAALEQYEGAGDARAAARANAIAGQALRTVRRYGEAGERLRSALDVLRDGPDADTVMALSELASIEAFTGGPDADALTNEALVLGQALDVDDHQLATLFIVRGLALYFLNRIAEGIANMEYAARLAESNGDTLSLGRALSNVATALLGNDPLAAAVAARTAAEHFRRVGAPGALAASRSVLANALLWSGDWDTAGTLLGEEAQADGLSDTIEMVQFRVLLDTLRGNVDAAEAILSHGDWGSVEDMQDRAFAIAVHMYLAAARDEPAAVLRWVGELPALIAAIGIRHEVVTWAWPVAARAAHELGDETALAHLTAMTDEHPRGHLQPLLRIERDLADARAGDDPASIFESAISALRKFGSPYHLALALLDEAAHPTTAADPARTELLLDEAVALAEALRARPLLARAERIRAVRPAQLVD
jgi:class 3 adenylate cyclase/tetratricopeptide (TPR) repeat protein